MEKQTAIRYNSKKEFFAIIDYFYKKGILPKVETFRGVITKYDYAFYEKNYDYYKDNCTCIVLDPLCFIGRRFEHKCNIVSFYEFNKKNRQMQKGVVKTKKGYTASEINFYVDDDGDIRYSYEVEPIVPKYKAGDVVMMNDGYMCTVEDWDGAFYSCNFDGFFAVKDGNLIFNTGWFKSHVKRLATPKEVFRYHKALRDAGYEWDAEKMEFVEYVWKPKEGESFFFVSGTGEIDTWRADNSYFSSLFIGVNNYFRTKEAAQAASDQIKEVLKNARKE